MPFISFFITFSLLEIDCVSPFLVSANNRWYSFFSAIKFSYASLQWHCIAFVIIGGNDNEGKHEIPTILCTITINEQFIAERK